MSAKTVPRISQSFMEGVTILSDITWILLGSLWLHTISKISCTTQMDLQDSVTNTCYQLVTSKDDGHSFSTQIYNPKSLFMYMCFIHWTVSNDLIIGVLVSVNTSKFGLYPLVFHWNIFKMRKKNRTSL